MVKMLSAAGARNVETRVRSSERKYNHHANTNHNVSFNNNQERDEWSDGDENEATHPHHGGLRRPDSKGSSKAHAESHSNNNRVERSGERERRHRPTLARPRLNVNKENIHDKFTMIKQRSRNGMDSMKQRSKRGFDTVKERGAKVLPRRPNIRLKSAPKDLPTRSLFRHEPRTWFGAKKDKGDKVKEDWRNARPNSSGGTGGGGASGSNNNSSPSKKELTRGRQEDPYHRKHSDNNERSNNRRSRSAGRRAKYNEDE